MWTENSMIVTDPPLGASKGKHLHGIDDNMNKIIDVAMTLDMVSLFADDPTAIRDGDFHELLSNF